ncbi:hypothetical protein DYB26_005616 [Aphanomyces astaci]|uniref:Uncharacterized protein n=1 Tax=Aphanomyces astaci TaxID=112090 RepID=A0A397F3Z3_APHAT|nr:hypothetical protein DYB31_003919 [Aphanomyces astaci]RHZ29734.1 hypothetical protein DYB26_005616 [Aphanomyces astaci]
MLYPPTPSYHPGPYEPAQPTQGGACPPTQEEDLDEYDANTALQFPGLRNLCDDGQPILYRIMTMYWKREAHLFQGFTTEDFADIDRHFAETMVRIQFSINPSLQRLDNLLSIVNYRKEIETICQERFVSPSTVASANMASSSLRPPSSAPPRPEQLHDVTSQWSSSTNTLESFAMGCLTKS